MDLTPFQNALSFVLAILGLAVVAAAFAAVLVLLLRGRLDGSDAIKVRDARDPKQTGLPGIPFYVKVGVIRHETSYLETLVTCTLTAVELSLDAAGCWYRRETPDAGGKADADAGDAQEKTQEAGA